MKHVCFVFYWLLQWTWGIVQNSAGLVMFLFLLGKRHFLYHGSVATVWNARGSLGLGMFIFISSVETNGEEFQKTLVHEYGHNIQSIILGPLFLPVIGLPSLLWCGLPLCRRYRQRKRVSYYRFYPERWANYLGEKITKGKAF